MPRLEPLVPLALLLALAAAAPAQVRNTENTLKLGEAASPLNASLDRLAWLAGSWRGEGLGGEVEELWSLPSGGTMMGGFKLLRDGKPSMYEFILIVEREEGVVLELKHFNPDFSGWEEKADFVRFPLVRLEPGEAYFSGLTYRRVGDELRIFLALRRGEALEEVPFVFHRVE